VGKYFLLNMITGILMTLFSVVFCTGTDNISAKIRDYRTWLFIASSTIILLLTAILYHNAGNFIGYFIVLEILLMALYYDIESRIIPDKLMVMGFVAGLILIPVNPSVPLDEALIGLLVTGVVFSAISYLGKGAIGWGDVKLLAITAWLIGWQMMLTTLLIAIILSVVTGIGLIVLKRSKRTDRIPFSPFILVGVLVCVFL